jgi:hypothetical protein
MHVHIQLSNGKPSLIVMINVQVFIYGTSIPLRNKYA